MSADHAQLSKGILLSAVLGIERQPLKLPTADGPFGAQLAQVTRRASERALLNAAAIIFLCERIGRLPATDDQPTPTIAEPDELPRCNSVAQYYLTRMLAGEYDEVLPEFLAELSEMRQRVPEENLPEFLNVGIKRPDLREAMAQVIGNRGRWLAAQNAEWNYIRSADEAETVWETGDRAARLTALKQLRASNPAQAREFLMSTWVQESPEDRAALLGALGIGLSMGDESFLEGVLDDRRKEVRLCAAHLLARLPESRLCVRMLARAEPLLKFKHNRLGGDRLEVTLPDACNSAMQRDGIEVKPPHSKVGAKAWWLMQMIATIPPQHWCEQWNKKPAELVKAAKHNDWKAALLEGWASTTALYPDADWAEALLVQWILDSGDEGAMLRRSEVIKGLVAALPPARREAIILRTLASAPASLHNHPILTVMHCSAHAWSIELSRAVLQSIRRHLASSNDLYDFELRGALQREFPRYMSPELLDEAVEGWTTQAPNWMAWQKIVDDFLALLQFRREMLKALTLNIKGGN